MASYDPVDPLFIQDPIVAQGAAQYYAEQADLNAETLWHESRAQAAAVEQARLGADAKINEFKAKFAPRRLPKTIAKKAWQKLDQKTGGRLTRLRYNGVAAAIGANKNTSPAIPHFTDIAFKLPDEPLVSVVIPVFNLLDITLECLRTLASIQESVSFEVIVVDDASTEPLMYPVLRRIPGIVYVRQTTNGGFVNSCNAGAAKARGEFIYFLNNDTKVKDNFLAPVVELYSNPAVGAVGSRLVHPTGLLQEAGGIIFSNGEGWNYGKTDDPDKAEYNFVREVDYCSGAGLSIRRQLFEQIGGFNRKLAPGYYEDVELCFAVRELGYRVLYQPRSVVVHYEGASSQSNAVEGKKPMKAYQEVNFHKFKKMRAQELAQQWPKKLEYLPLIARRKRGLRIWVFDWFIPMPDRDYGSARMLSILKMLARDHTVTFVSRDVVDRPEYRKALYQIGVDVCPRALGANFTNILRAQGKFIDLAIVARPEVMHFFYHVLKRFAPHAPIIYDTVDVHHKRLERERDREQDPQKRMTLDARIAAFKTLEQTYTRLADRTWAITKADQKVFSELVPGAPVDVVSATHEPLANVPGVQGRTGLFFVGSFHHPPNVAAIEYYIRELYPRLKRYLPQVELTVVGRPVPERLKKLALEQVGSAIRFVGGVSDAALLEHHLRARVFVCPLLFGSGLKGKIVMAMASGLPVVTTTVGVEGIPVQDQRDIEIADTPDEMVKRIVALYTDDQRWLQRSRNAQDVVVNNYSEKNLLREISTSITSLGDKIASGRYNHDPIV